MDLKIVKVTDKGQISLPIRIRESLNIDEGDELVIMKSEDAIIIKKIRIDDFKDLLKHSERVAKKLWDNKEDEVWNDF
jgi:AbrB family looped-hinge helix DNA binding protein